MDENLNSPPRKKKRRNPEYLARKADKRRLKGENARSAESRLARMNSDRRLTEESRLARRNTDVRRTEESRLALKNAEVRRTEDSRLARKNAEVRRTEESQLARRNAEVRRTEESQLARRNAEVRRTEESRLARRNPDVRRTEESRLARRNPDVRRTEVSRNARRNNDFRRSELSLELRRQLRKDEYLERRQDLEVLVAEYEHSIREGPTYVCQSCGCLFFEHSIRVYLKSEIRELTGELFKNLDGLANDCSDLFFCITCSKDIMKRRIPRLNLNNGFYFPEIPSCLQILTILEERLVSPRLPFMQIRELRVGKQFGIRGNVVNVPVSVDKSIDVLPRTFDKTETIQLVLKRMRQHKSHYLNEFIRPAIVYQAAEFLVKQPLYIKEEVTLKVDWNQLYEEELQKFIVNPEDDDIEQTFEEDADKWDETIGDIPLNPNKEETLLKEGIVFAPGEGELPLSILNDSAAEELAFPTIFGGLERQLKGRFSYSDICRSELKRADRRCCTPTNIFFKYRKKEMEQHRNAIRTYLRKGYAIDGSLNVQQALDGEYLSRMVKDDEAYRVMAGDRSSPAYWQSKMKDLMAMIRQLGIPTFFLTLSAAETQWPELLVILVKVLKNEEITYEQALSMSFIEKSELIRRDPVTCARYFDHRVRQLFKIIRSECGPFKGFKTLDTYIRVEFQSRGSPHVHCLLWLEGAPVFDASSYGSKEECESFISRFISCEIGSLNGIERLQFHKHSGTCKKTARDNIVCRFGIPQFPMRRVHILQPLPDDDLSDSEIDTFDVLMSRIMKALDYIDKMVMSKDPDLDTLTFDDFLESIPITEETYIRVMRNTLRRPQVFLQRSPKECRINAYNPVILSSHRANMDLQYILDPYACVHYILNYINKSNRGMSALLKQVVDECKQGNVSHQQKLYRICSKFINCSEVSIQEAVYVLLRMPLSMASRDTIFINTGEKEKRIRILKMTKELEKLDPDSTEIMSTGLLEYYVNRPDELEPCCLADFAACFVHKRFIKISEHTNGAELIAEIPESRSKSYELKNRMGTIVERKRPKIIRYRKYQLEKDPANFYREKVMLFLPWRNEEEDILQKDVKMLFVTKQEQIRDAECKYVFNSQMNLEKIEDKVQEDMRISFGNMDQEEIPEGYQIFDLQNPDFNIESEIQESGNNKKAGFFLSPNIISDESYYSIVRSLNERQRNFLMGLMNVVKTSRDPFYYFLSGGAGAGKSLLIKAVYQSLNRWFNKGGANPDNLKVMVTGPTGKSAFNVRGTTLHSALNISVTQCGQSIKNLSPDVKNSMKTKLWSLKLIIIDEVSMVGASMLGKIDYRLKELFNPHKTFGGISIIFVGDLNQLRPVMDSFVFETQTKLTYSILAGSILWSSVKFYKLTEIMRQRDDLIFAGALNRLASGQLTEEDKQLFKTRLFAKDSPLLPKGAIRLFQHNRQVDNYNERAILESFGTLHKSLAIDFATQDMPRKAREQALYIVSQLPTQSTYNLPKALSLKVGIRYMVSTNVDVEDGLVNGTSGVLRIIDIYQEYVSRLWFEFEESDIGFKARSKLQARLENGKVLTPIDRVVRDIQTKTEGRFVMVSRKQFPLLIAEAMTIHKAQGQTYDQVVIDMARKLDLAKFYTSFSRSRSLAGLFLVGEEINFPRERPASHPVSLELERLEKEAPLIFDLKFPAKIKGQEQLAIFFQNLPFLQKHAKDLTSDNNILACDILALIESRSNNVNIDGFDLRHSIDFGIDRPFGINFYVKSGLDWLTSSSKIKVDIGDEKDHIEHMRVDLKSVVLLIFYVSPTFPKRDALRIIEAYLARDINRNIMVFGDWNIDLKSKLGQEFRQMMAKMGLGVYPDVCRPSTDYMTTIDYLFSSIDIKDAFYYESLYSDHKPLICLIDQPRD